MITNILLEGSDVLCYHLRIYLLIMLYDGVGGRCQPVDCHGPHSPRLTIVDVSDADDDEMVDASGLHAA